jgi:uncharacterized membrane protein
MLSAARFVNRGFLERTLVFLLFVSVIPWPTALAADYVTGGGEPARTIALLYAGTMLSMGLAFALSWRFLARHPELVAEPAREAVPGGARRALLGSLAYLPALAFAPVGSLAIDGANAVYFAVSRTAVPGLIHRAGQGDEAG